MIKMTQLTFTLIMLVFLAGFIGIVFGYHYGKKDERRYWEDLVDRLNKRHSTIISEYDNKIFTFNAEAASLQDTVRDLKMQQKITKRDYEKAIASVDTLTSSQLQRYFTDRFGGDSYGSPGKVSYTRTDGTGLPESDGESLPKGVEDI